MFLLSLHQLICIQLSDQDQLQHNESLIEAAKGGRNGAVTSLLHQGADVNYTTQDGITALREAAAYGHVDTVRVLIDRGAHVNQTYKNGSTVLIGAVHGGHPGQREIVRVLIEHGADINHADNRGATALTCVSCHSSTEIARVLVEHGADVNYISNIGSTALIEAAIGRRTHTITLLLRYGAPLPPAIDRELTIRILDETKISPLARAIITRNRDAVIRLLDENNATIVGRIVSYFLPHRVNYRDNFGMTALHWGVAQNYGALVEDLLAEYNPDLTIQDDEGNTPLNLAARNGNDLILQVLLACGADISAQNNNGDTPLHLAIRAGRTAIVRQLLRANAHMNIRNSQGLTPRSLAQRYPHHRAIRDLLEPIAGQALLRLLSTEGQQGRLGVLHTDNNTNGTAQPLPVVPNGILPAEIAARIAGFVVAHRQPAQLRSNSNSNS